MLPPIMITAPTRTILNPTDNISELAKNTVVYCVSVAHPDPPDGKHWM